jgi:spoIIIJ-associated protein
VAAAETEEETADIPPAPAETKPQPAPAATESASEAADEAMETDGAPEIDPEVLELGESILRLMIKSITPDADLRQTEVTDRICFQVAGGNSAVIIGKRGQTLEAIQYLVEKIVNKHNAQRVRVRVDVEGYLDKRREQLERMAERMAGKAKKSKKPVTLGQLNAHDRRIVHLALKDDGEVRTQSMGEGFYRKLVVFPRKGKKKRNAANK